MKYFQNVCYCMRCLINWSKSQVTWMKALVASTVPCNNCSIGAMYFQLRILCIDILSIELDSAILRQTTFFDDIRFWHVVNKLHKSPFYACGYKIGWVRFGVKCLLLSAFQFVTKFYIWSQICRKKGEKCKAFYRFGKSTTNRF